MKPLTHSNLAAIEQGRYVPRFDDILSLSMVLNVPVHRFEEKLKLDLMAPEPCAAPEDWDELMKLGMETMHMGDYDGALVFFRKAFTTCDASEPRGRRSAESRLYVANCLRRLGLLRIAKDELETLLTYPELGPPMLARIYFVMGDMYRYQGNMELARLHLEAAYKLVEETQDLRLQGKVYNSLANLHADLKEYRKAAALYRKAVKNFKSLKDTRFLIMSEIALGICMAEQGAFDDVLEAIRLVESGLARAKKASYRRESSLAGLALAKIHYHRKTYGAVVRYAEGAKEIAQEEQFPDVLFQSLYYLWETAKKQKKLQLAQVYCDRLLSLRDKMESTLEEVRIFDESVKPAREEAR